MRKAVIWDLDGTLFDSYEVIVESLYLAIAEHGVVLSMHEIHQHAIKFSIQSLLANISKETGVPVEVLNQSYSRISSSKYLNIKAMHNAVEALSSLHAKGIENYVFTHRGRTTLPVLENLKMTGFFKEIVTSQNGFARKPDPEGLAYLISKYDLSKDSTYYVGDRSIDMDCAMRAGIPGILYLPQGSIDVSGGSETHIIQDLLEISNIV